VDLGRKQMGDLHYTRFWNAAESVVDLIAPNSQYNLDRSIDTDAQPMRQQEDPGEAEQREILSRCVPAEG
jgi:hypothetical protein